MKLPDETLKAMYRELANHPAFLDNIEAEEKMTVDLKEKFWDDETIETDKLLKMREEIRIRQSVIKSLRMRITIKSAKEQR
jgi:hypothetical protein